MVVIFTNKGLEELWAGDYRTRRRGGRERGILSTQHNPHPSWELCPLAFYSVSCSSWEVPWRNWVTPTCWLRWTGSSVGLWLHVAKSALWGLRERSQPPTGTWCLDLHLWFSAMWTKERKGAGQGEQRLRESFVSAGEMESYPWVLEKP